MRGGKGGLRHAIRRGAGRRGAFSPEAIYAISFFGLRLMATQSGIGPAAG